MKTSRFYHDKKHTPTFLLLSIMLLASLDAVVPYAITVFAPDGPTVAVVPVNNVWNPAESFDVNITITDAVDLYSYEVRLGYDPNILELTGIEEGPFIKDQTTSPMGTMWSTVEESNFVYAVCVTMGAYPGVSGSGTLFTVTFTVKAAGESALHLYDTMLLDSTGSEISHSTSDGNFHTRVPVAAFSFTPDIEGRRPIIGENVTFDASASYDPDGGNILSCTWDFDDGTGGTGMIVNHIYNVPTNASTAYNVTLTVTDDDDESNTVSQDVHVYYHDISVLEVVTPEEIFLHEMAAINVTILSNSSHQDTFNVTAYYDSKPIGTQTAKNVNPGENKTVSFDWYTYVDAHSVSSSNITIGENWIYPSNVSDSDDLYTYCNSNNTYQEYTGYEFGAAGWTGISRAEVGIEVRTDTGGNDQINIAVSPDGGAHWGENHVYDIATTTDRFFWVDVTGDLAWSLGAVNNTRVRIQYIQRGVDATPIYVDWLQVRITALNPTDIPEGTYVMWANAYLVDEYSLDYRPGEEADTTDNTLFGNPTTITLIPTRDIAITNVTVSPTDVAIGTASTVKVEIKNQGNTEETFDVFLYANSTEVRNQTSLTLLAGATRTLRFTWYAGTNSTLEGVYNVTVVCGKYNETKGTVDPLLNETDITNNNQTTFRLMRLLPAPFFTFSPSEPAIAQQVTFDASASYAPGEPGGTIDQYAWDFGDGFDGTGVIVTHAYNKPGSYSVTLTVTDNENLNNTKTATVTVPKFPSTITISASTLTVPTSLNTTISGFISPVRANAAVTINYTSAQETTWATLANVTTNDKGEYSYIWTPTETGFYKIKAFWPGDTNTLGAESSLLNVTVTVQDTAITEIILSEIKVTAGESVTVDVTVVNKGTATETFNVAVYYNNTLIETKTVSELAAGGNRTISFDWDTQGVEKGIYVIKAVAESLPGETQNADNSRTSWVVIETEEEKETAVNIYLYTTIGLAIAIVAMAAYLLKMRKPKPKQKQK
jgi:PKD repeat protein